MKDERLRIEKDIELFEENISRYSTNNEKKKEVVDLAKRYCDDAKYYLAKGDLLTAFGCINYAHGLLDALIKIE
ncbi:MAG TPA: DUF357 domain-containing protein [Thermoplasmatales archaeon]|nr:DUF357 domain-containing protein [Thermoplasmatales archaeon]